MSYVFVLDPRPTQSRPSGPGTQLLTSRQAAVFKRSPFTVILKRALPEASAQPLRLKLDPGSRTTGMALVNDTRRSGCCRGNHPSGPAGQGGVGEAPRSETEPAGAQDTLSSGTVFQSAASDRLVAPFSGEPPGEHHHLGETAPAALPAWGTQHGVGTLRHPAASAPRYQRHPLSAGRAGRL